MVRGNCDYIFLQPIFNHTQREILWDLEAGFMERKDFSQLMDDVIVRENLPGNTASEPKKKVQIMVCADFEDSSVPQEKFFSYMPVAMDMLPPFTLLDARYWENNDQVEHSAFAMPQTKTQFQELQAVETTMKIFK